MANVSTIRMPRRLPLGATKIKKKGISKTASLFFGGKTALIGSLAICLLLLMVVKSAVSKSECELIAAERQNKSLWAEKDSLEKEWRYLRSPSRIEQLAKRELGLQSPSKEQLIASCIK